MKTLHMTIEEDLTQRLNRQVHAERIAYMVASYMDSQVALGVWESVAMAANAILTRSILNRVHGKSSQGKP